MRGVWSETCQKISIPHLGESLGRDRQRVMAGRQREQREIAAVIALRRPLEVPGVIAHGDGRALDHRAVGVLHGSAQIGRSRSLGDGGGRHNDSEQ